MILDYLQDVKINKFDLDNELVRQPELCLQYSDAHAQAEYDLAKAKEQLDVIRAQLDARIREEAQRANEKLTETVVGNRVILHPDYRAALAIYHEKQRIASMLKSAAMTFATSRKEALENLVRLHLGNYYSRPVLPENRTAMDSVELSAGYNVQVSGLNTPTTKMDKPRPVPQLSKRK